jgi:1-acyl-sn-glycerol-3-phosphate acyltransferase
VQRPRQDPLAARLRYTTGFLVTAAAALGLDAWLRVFVLLRHRNDEKPRLDGVHRIQRRWGIVIFGVARRFLKLRVRVEGTPPTGGRFLVVSNHQSSLDIPLLISTLRNLNLSFVAMEQLRHGHPVISPVLRHGGAVFVKKESLSEDFVALDRFGREVERFDASPLIFPEGGLARDGNLRPFRPAGIEVVRRTSRLPLLPVTVDGLWPAPSIHEYGRLIGARVTVRIGTPISCEDVDADPRAAYERIEGEMRKVLEEIRGRDQAVSASR